MEDQIDIKSKVHIVGDFYMVADSCQFILIQRVTRTGKKDGKQYEDFDTIGYYSKLAGLCKAAIKKTALQEVRAGYLKTLGDVIRREEQLERDIENAIGQVL